jgi:hypothetical protein
MNRLGYKQLLLDLNPQEVAQHSVLNHHVDGMDYLCLHRSDKLTAKLYFIDPTKLKKQYGEELVVRHTHRYAFESTVLAGMIVHQMYDEDKVGMCEPSHDRYVYDPDTRMRVGSGAVRLYIKSERIHFAGGMGNDSYWVDTTDIHTLIVPNNRVLLGLMQFADTVPTSTVYLRKGAEMVYPESRTPTPEEAWALRDRALEMMEGL